MGFWMNLGYACINMTLSSGKEKVRTNRGIIKKTFASDSGLQKTSQLALQNSKDLLKIIKWNEKNNIKFFRISSEIIPWASEYEISKLPDYKEIREALFLAGAAAKRFGHRLTFHPGPYNKLCSDKESIVRNTIRDLEIHGEVMDMLEMPRTHYAKINIHVGGAYGDKLFACGNFIRNFKRLSGAVKTRLTVENDDRESLYSVKDLYDMVYLEIGIPIVFDFHHHRFRYDLSQKDALALAVSTWNNTKPVVHYSESRCEEKMDNSKPNAHSDYVYEKIDLYGFDVDVMIEAKAKELALLNYRNSMALSV